MSLLLTVPSNFSDDASKAYLGDNPVFNNLGQLVYAVPVDSIDNLDSIISQVKTLPIPFVPVPVPVDPNSKKPISPNSDRYMPVMLQFHYSPTNPTFNSDDFLNRKQTIQDPTNGSLLSENHYIPTVPTNFTAFQNQLSSNYDPTVEDKDAKKFVLKSAFINVWKQGVYGPNATIDDTQPNNWSIEVNYKIDTWEIDANYKVSFDATLIFNSDGTKTLDLIGNTNVSLNLGKMIENLTSKFTGFKLPQDIADFTIKNMEVQLALSMYTDPINPENHTYYSPLISFNFTISSETQWQIVPNLIALNPCNIELTIGSGLVSAEILDTVFIQQAPFLIDVSFPPLRGSLQLVGNGYKLIDLLPNAFIDNKNLDTLTISAANVQYSENFASFYIEINESLVLHGFTLTSITFEITHTNGAWDIGLRASASIPSGISFDVSAEYNTDAGWQFIGRYSSLEKTIIDLGKIVSDLLGEKDSQVEFLNDIQFQAPQTFGISFTTQSPKTLGFSGTFDINDNLSTYFNFSFGGAPSFEFDLINNSNTAVKLSDLLSKFNVGDFPGEAHLNAILQINSFSLSHTQGASSFSFSHVLGNGNLVVDLDHQQDSGNLLSVSWIPNDTSSTIGLEDLEKQFNLKSFRDGIPTSLGNLNDSINKALTFSQLSLVFTKVETLTTISILATPADPSYFKSFSYFREGGDAEDGVLSLSLKDSSSFTEFMDTVPLLGEIVKDMANQIVFEPTTLCYSSMASDVQIPPLTSANFQQAGNAGTGSPNGAQSYASGPEFTFPTSFINGLSLSGNIAFPDKSLVNSLLGVNSIEGGFTIGNDVLELNAKVDQFASEGSQLINKLIDIFTSSDLALKGGKFSVMEKNPDYLSLTLGAELISTKGSFTLKSEFLPYGLLTGIHFIANKNNPFEIEGFMTTGITPSIGGGLETRFYIAKNNDTNNDLSNYPDNGSLKLLVDITDDGVNIPYIDFEIDKLNFEELTIAVFGTSNPVEPKLNPILSSINSLISIEFDYLKLEWADQIVPNFDNEQVTPGVAFRGFIKLDLLSMEEWHAWADFHVSTNPAGLGVKGDFELEPIQLESVLNITGDGKGKTVSRKIVNVDKTTTYATYTIAPGGPNLQIDSSQDPHLHLSFNAQLFDIISEKVSAEIDDKGFSFEIDSNSFISQEHIKCSMKNSGSFKGTFTFATGPFSLVNDIKPNSFDVDASLTIDRTKNLMTIDLGFTILGKEHTITDIPINGINKIEDVITKLVNKVISYLGPLMGDVFKVIGWVATNIIGPLATEAIKALNLFIPFAMPILELSIRKIEDVVKIGKDVYQLADDVICLAMRCSGKSPAEIFAIIANPANLLCLGNDLLQLGKHLYDLFIGSTISFFEDEFKALANLPGALVDACVHYDTTTEGGLSVTPVQLKNRVSNLIRSGLSNCTKLTNNNLNPILFLIDSNTANATEISISQRVILGIEYGGDKSYVKDQANIKLLDLQIGLILNNLNYDITQAWNDLLNRINAILECKGDFDFKVLDGTLDLAGDIEFQFSSQFDSFEICSAQSNNSDKAISIVKRLLRFGYYSRADIANEWYKQLNEENRTHVDWIQDLATVGYNGTEVGAFALANGLYSNRTYIDFINDLSNATAPPYFIVQAIYAFTSTPETITIIETLTTNGYLENQIFSALIKHDPNSLINFDFSMRSIMGANLDGANLSNAKLTNMKSGLISATKVPILPANWNAIKVSHSTELNHALSFAGFSPISIPNDLKNTPSLTIEYWLKTSMKGLNDPNWYNGTTLVNNGGLNGFGSSLMGDNWAFGVSYTDTTLLSKTKVNTGEWIHVAGTWKVDTDDYKHARMNLYINGRLEATTDLGPNELRNEESNITLGDIRGFVGEIAELRLWNIARTADDIHANMGHILDPYKNKNLVGYYQFNEPAGSQQLINRVNLKAFDPGNFTVTQLIDPITHNGEAPNYLIVGPFADLTGIDFSGLDLSQVNFTGATLNNANFCRTKLHGTIFTDAKLENAKTFRLDSISDITLPNPEENWKIYQDKNNQAPVFDGTVNVNCGNDISLQLNTGTIEAWFNLDIGSSNFLLYNYESIIVKGYAYGIYIYNFRICVYDWSKNTHIFIGPKLEQKKWYHLAFSFDSGTENGSFVYLNGFQIGESFTYTVNNQNSNLILGGILGTNENFQGNIDEIRIWNIQRSMSDIRQSKSKDLLPQTDGLVAYYKIQETDQHILKDLSGNKNDGVFSKEIVLPSDIALVGPKVNLSHVNFSYSNLVKLNLDKVNLKHANLSGVWSEGILGKPYLPKQWICRGGRLIGPTVYLIEAILNEKQLAGTYLSGANLSKANLSNAKSTIIKSNLSLPSLPNGWSLVQLEGGIYHSIKMDGSSYIALTCNNLPAGNSPYTIELWIKPSSINHTVGLIGWGNWAAYQVNAFEINENSQLLNDWWAGNNNLLTNIPNALDGNWHHVACSYDGTNRTIYFDGIFMKADKPNAANIVRENFMMGLATDADYHYMGEMAEVRIWNIGKTQSEIVALKNSPISPNTSGLVAYYQFDGKTLDLTPNGNNPTNKPSGITYPNYTEPINGHNTYLLLSPNKDLSGLDLSFQNLQSLDLTNGNLSNTNLDGTDLSHVTLTGIQSGGITGTPVLPTNWSISNGFLKGPGAN